MSARVTVDSTKFRQTLQELRRFKRMDIPKFVRWRAKIACQDLIKWTPPVGPSPGSEGWKVQLKIGMSAINHDIGLLWVSAAHLLTKMESRVPKLAAAFKRYVRQRNLGAVQKILRDLGFVNVSDIVRDASEEQHDMNRDARTGRVRKKGHPILVLGVNSIKQLARKKIADIGTWKSGWGASAAALGVSIRDWPLWVRKHGNRGSILIQNSENASTITMTNDQGRFADERIVQNVLRINEHKAEMELKAMMDAKASKESRR